MMEVQTDTLTGPALDWAVAQCENREIRVDPMGFVDGSESGYWIWEDNRSGKKAAYMLIGREYSPSTRWEQGGAILDKLRESARHQFLMESDGENTHVLAWSTPHTFSRGYGPSVLVAVMRCYVASHFGETIKIPEGLMS
jgi:hypothetical protein